MTKSQAIQDHTILVNHRRSLAARDNFQSDEAKAQAILYTDREISTLGQVHNPRISEKSRKSLNLN